MTKQTKTKPKCNKGTACGYACISGKKQCSERIKALDAAELLKATGALAKTDKTKSNADVKLFKGDYEGLAKSTVTGLVKVPPDNTVEIKLSEKWEIKSGVSALDIDIFVNGEADAGRSKVDKASAVRVAVASLRAVSRTVSKLSDGVVLTAYSYDGDSKGEDRDKAYQKAGFGPRSDKGRLYAIVVGGKITPIAKEDLDLRWKQP